MLKEVNESKFNMWRAIVALVHADLVSHPQEAEYLKNQFQKIPFSETQRKVLSDDLLTSKDVDPYFKAITSPGDKAQFVYFARILFWSDGAFHEQEKAILDRLHKETISKVDLTAVMRSVDNIANEFVHERKERNFSTILADFVDRFLS